MAHSSRSNSGTLVILSLTFFTGAFLYFKLSESFREKFKERKLEPRCFSRSTPSLTAFKTLTQQITPRSKYRLASKIEKNVPIYDCSRLDLLDSKQTFELQDEFYDVLISGPGVFIMKHFFKDLDTIDAANKAYDIIIQQESTGTGVKGDHFAPASANSRIWNSFSKHALEDTQSFTQYFSNPWLKVVCESYLGPAYRLTSQVNIVHPGGKAQMPHRDYHLGFQTDEEVLKWPKSIHAMSSFLTLQGAVAHTNMPLESGPTRLLPYSHMFEEGYRSFRSQPFIDYFQENYIALPLEKGDAMFFNPALFHAAGENRTLDFSRSANLIQVSSAFGKPMETIDTLPLIEVTYDLLSEKYGREGMSMEVDAFVRAVAEGYPFPTNLDCRPPAPGGQAPESEQDILRRGLNEGWERQRMVNELTAMREASSASGWAGR